MSQHKSMNLSIPLADVTEEEEHLGHHVQVHVSYSTSTDSYGLRHDLRDLHIDSSSFILHDTLEAEVLTYAEKLWEAQA